MPEVGRDGVTGVICETDEDMVAAIRQVAKLNRAACRKEFEQRFSVHRMTSEYVTLYERCLQVSHPMATVVPQQTTALMSSWRQQSCAPSSLAQGTRPHSVY